ncbi:aminodeoxychorismate synthase component I [Jatrophihabitans sp.]|uniref:aminodeoxychorismate synthase component I n=1 Tax=Jatrophihabitans sp. TaxID=1932789 RepID=UPI0030C67C8F|nr:Chorismate binding-like protein [Jatrophihabitans sp.]
MTLVDGLVVRPVSEWLAPVSDPAVVLRSAAGSTGLAALIGAWAGGGALLVAAPLLVLPGGADPIDALASRPRLGTPAPEDFVGGGWFGWLAFDGPSRLAFYDHVLRLRADGWYFEALVSDQRDALLQVRCEEFAALLDSRPSRSAGWQVGAMGGASRLRHLAAVEEAIEAVRAGDVYQANVCTRLAGAFEGSAPELFTAATAALRPAYGAYIESADSTLASLSPELFLRRRGREVRSEPIKGTAPQSAGGEAALRQSAKDAAENVMIVDLFRNDLGSVAETGSVTVPELLSVQPHTGVWQLVSTVSAQLRAEVTDADLLRAAFPPGSVTGAPKSRAVQVVAAVEAGPRGAYTGAVGFVSPVWGLELSVAIRTFEIGDGQLQLGVGGGVTADSVPMLEWRECLHKATPLLTAVAARLAPDVATPECPPTPEQLAGGLLETMLCRDGAVLRLADHLARLDRSCRELYGLPVPANLLDDLLAAATRATGRAVLRAIVAPVGRTLRGTVTLATAGARPEPSAARTVLRPGGLWRHKWAGRDALTADETRLGTPLYLAPDGAVLETSRGSVFLIEPDGGLVTPPLRDDLLPGVTRRALLDQARDTGRRHSVRPFGSDELLANAAFWTSSVSLAVPIAAVDGVALPRRDAEIAQLAAGLADR